MRLRARTRMESNADLQFADTIGLKDRYCHRNRSSTMKQVFGKSHNRLESNSNVKSPSNGYLWYLHLTYRHFTDEVPCPSSPDRTIIKSDSTPQWPSWQRAHCGLGSFSRSGFGIPAHWTVVPKLDRMKGETGEPPGDLYTLLRKWGWLKLKGFVSPIWFSKFVSVRLEAVKEEPTSVENVTDISEDCYHESTFYERMVGWRRRDWENCKVSEATVLYIRQSHWQPVFDTSFGSSLAIFL